MKKSVRLSLRVRLLALVLLTLAPAFALIIYNAVEDNQRATAEVKTTALRLVRLAAQNHEQLIDDAHDLLTLLTGLPPALLTSPDCQDLLTDLSSRYPNFGTLIVLDLRGTVKCSTRPGYSEVNFADRHWFKEATESRRFVVSEYLVGRVSTKPSVVFAAPLTGGSGSVQGLVSVSASLEWLNRLSEHAQLPAGSTFTIIDGNGTVLARQPEAEWVGRPYTQAQLVRTILTRKQEGTDEIAGLDGVDRLYAFKPLGVHGHVRSWYLAIGIPKEAAYGQTRAMLLQNLVFMAIVAVLMLAAAWLGTGSLVVQPIRSLVDASAKWGKGNLSARTGMAHRQDEIGQLAGAFDQMAAALQTREADRLGAEQTRAQLAAIVESSSDAIIGRTLDGTITSWNKGAENLFDYAAEEMIGNSIMLLVPGNEIDRVAENFERIERGGRVESYEAVRLSKGGTPINVSVSVSPIIDDGGKVIGASSITRDISERKRSESEIKALHDINLAITSTLNLQTVLQILLEKIEIELPYTASHIRLINKATGKLEPVTCRNIDEEQWKAGDTGFQHSIHRTILQSKRPLVIPNLQSDERNWRQEFYREQGLVSYLGMPLIVKEEAIGVLSLLTKERHSFTLREVRFAETLAKQASIAIYNSQLYEESKKLTDELADSEEQIHVLANGLIHARDEEARRIAHALHDESGQLLAMVYIALDEMAKGLSAADKDRVQTIKGLLDDVEKRLRDISHELHPAMLDHLGLIPSVEHLAKQISKRTGIQIKVAAGLNERLSPLLELSLFRAVQEAFNNVVRHAQAKTVEVRIMQDEELIQCAIQDDGAGFNPIAAWQRQKQKGQGLGLAGMRERIEGIGGIFQILSAPGEGTKLFISVSREKCRGAQSTAG
jgi:PAS domain S-box-containing protein